MEGWADPDKLKALVSLLAPGLIILGLRDAVQSGPRSEIKDRLLLYAAISAGYYAAAFPIFNWRGGLVLSEAAWSLLQYVALPTMVGLAAAYESQRRWFMRVASRLGLQLAHPIPAAWDYVFGELDAGAFVLVTLDDGAQLGGLMGSRSFASSSREERDLFIEEVWETAGSGAWTKAEPIRSILLCGRDIRYIEIF